MKKFLAILILVFMFQTPSQADDIRDFQVEGMSVGDSLFDYFSEEEIKKKINSYPDKGYIYPSKEFYSITFRYLPRFETYDAVQIQLRNKNEKYNIYSLSGHIFFEDNIQDCYKKKDEIVKEISKIFLDFKKRDQKKIKHPADKTGKSTYTSVYFNSELGDYISVRCYDWSKEMKIVDKLTVSLVLEEFGNWLNNLVYK